MTRLFCMLVHQRRLLTRLVHCRPFHWTTHCSFAQSHVKSLKHAMVYTTKQIGALNSLEYRCYLGTFLFFFNLSLYIYLICSDFTCAIEKDGQVVSAFHDVPLYADASKKICNMVVEIPKFSNAKLEVPTTSSPTPILTFFFFLFLSVMHCHAMRLMRMATCRLARTMR